MGALINIFFALAPLLAFLYNPTRTQLSVLGFFKDPVVNTVVPAGDFITIADTVHCEDLHYLPSANLLFTACEDDPNTRKGWFPGAAHLSHPESAGQGSIHVIDPETHKSRRLRFTNFSTPLITHGIDILPDPTSPQASLYILAVNHLPNPLYKPFSPSSQFLHQPRAASRLELFHHVLGSDDLVHLRSISHPLITTPNDLHLVSPTEFYATNDHHYREGWKRGVEDLVPAAKWSSVVHVSLSSLSSLDPTSGVEAKIAQRGIHNNNGMGRGPNGEVLITSAASGQLHLADIHPSDARLDVKASVRVDSAVDNPSYFSDPYAAATADGDRSAYVVPGLARAVQFLNPSEDGKMATVVWMARRNGEGEWEKNCVFLDDGSRVSGGSAAVVVAIDPAKEGGKRRGWLWITGFASTSVVAVKIDL